jgi:hypothetical protein
MKGILAILMAGIMIAAMIAPAMGGNADTSATVGNVPPVVCDKWEGPDDMAADGTQVIPNACPNATPVTIYACVYDANGNDDIASVTAVVTGGVGYNVVLSRDVTMDASCGPDCIGYSGTFDMDCCEPAGVYTVVVTVTDVLGTTGTMENTFEYMSLIAMTAGDVVFGSVAPGGNSTATSTVNCMGNAAIVFADVDPADYDDPDPGDGIAWSDMVSAATDVIDDDQITTTWSPAATITCGNSGDVPFKLDVPFGTPSGVYAGTVVFTPLV